MAKRYYLPGSDTERVQWMNTFNLKLPAYAALFSIDPATLSSVDDDTKAWKYMVNYVETTKTDKQEAVAYKDSLRAGDDADSAGAYPSATVSPVGPPGTVVNQSIFKRIGELVKIIKAHPGYTPSIGKDLGIIGDDINFNAETFKTVLMASVHLGYINIFFFKGEVDAVNLYSRLQGNTEWELVATMLTSPYSDTRPLAHAGRAEIREYVGVGLIGNEEIGVPSDIVQVAFAG